MLDDAAFQSAFEDLTLDPTHFSHRGHLRIAWLYLMQNDCETAVQKVCSGIKTYAESLGASTKFNLTITDALVRIMADRIEQMEEKDWPLFLEQNPDLIEDSLALLFKYFTEDVLLSEAARTSLVQPDIRPLAA